MKKFNYFPIMKTRDAELKAMSKLSSGVFDHILPIYELTKSRKAKIAPDGDIHRRMLTIKDIQGERPFILDLTSNEKYINDQIRQLVDEKDGYYEWRYFINLYNLLNSEPADTYLAAEVRFSFGSRRADIVSVSSDIAT
ncbi:hypothetical protein AB0T36_20465, partial [Escherichia coli]